VKKSEEGWEAAIENERVSWTTKTGFLPQRAQGSQRRGWSAERGASGRICHSGCAEEIENKGDGKDDGDKSAQAYRRKGLR